MTTTPDSWPALSFLEGLRPGLDETVELALLGSYSADLGSVGAVLLALAGKDSDAGRGSASDFADAVERLRGKVRIVVQRGRLARMRRTPRIAAVLDQFVREVPFDEAWHSWHPKVALVRLRTEAGETRWRLWIGSRNLTQCINRDIGLLLVSGGKKAQPVPGLAELARTLAERAELKSVRSDTLARALAKTVWRAPAGITVERVRWSPGTGKEEPPKPPTRTEEIVVVSPFIDTGFLALQAVAGKIPARRVLLTTMREIDRVGPALSTVDELLALDAPDYPVGDLEPEGLGGSDGGLGETATDEEEEIGRGLHAKLLFWRTGRQRTLWLGSANATMRAWSGRNAEVTAELSISASVEDGLRALLGSARRVTPPAKPAEPDGAASDEKELEQARAQVAARWAATLAVDDGGFEIKHCSDAHPGGPHPDASAVVLEIGSLHGEMRPWPRGQRAVHLGPVLPAERTEFVRLRVRLGDKGMSWLQRAPANPPFGEERDRAAFVRFLGARGFLLWLAGLLADDGREGEGDWTIDHQAERLSLGKNPALDPSLPTLEEMLAAWSRDGDRFREIERKVSDYLPAVLEQAGQEDLETARMLQRFDELWRTLRAGLGQGGRARRR